MTRPGPNIENPIPSRRRADALRLMPWTRLHLIRTTYNSWLLPSNSKVCGKGDCKGPVIHINDLGDVKIYVNLKKIRMTIFIKKKFKKSNDQTHIAK